MKLLLILLAAAGLTKGPLDVNITAQGGAAVDGCEITVSAYEKGWKTLDNKVDWKRIESTPGSFRLQRKNTVHFDGQWKWQEAGGGKIRGEVSIKCVTPIDLQSFALTFKFPVETFGGEKWRAGDREGTIPEDAESRFSGSGSSSTFNLPLKSGRTLEVHFDSPTKYTLQDGRRWGNYVSFRTGSYQSLNSIRKGEIISFSFTLSSKGGLKLVRFKPLVIEEGKDWIKMENRKDIVPGSALDFSGMNLLDGPAGKYGWLKAVGGSFEFEGKPGVPQRFYGVNLCFTANFPEHEVADKLIERFTSLGYNTIRIHHHDDEWSNSEESRDKLDYLLAKAYEKGFYVTTDLYVSRKVKWSDIDVEREGTIDKGDFKRALIGSNDAAFNNWCNYARMWFNHVNPYTGRAMKDEPGMPLISLINEGKMGGSINECFKFESVRRVWDEYSGGKPIPKKGSREADEFDTWFSRQTFEKCAAYVRSLGIRALLTNDNNGAHHADGEGCTPLYDYVDNHFYVDHPKFLDRKWNLPVFVGNVSPVRNGGPQMFKHGFAQGASKPYTITEWNFSGPGRFRGIGGVMTGALASIQEWDGLWRFTYTHTNANLVDNPDATLRYFDLATDPLMQASDRAAVCLYLRGDVKSDSELSRNSETGVLTLATERSCGVFAEEGGAEAGVLKVSGLEKPATVFLTSIDGKPLSESERMLITHLTDIQGIGAKYADSERHILLSFGKGILLERGKAVISVKVESPASRYHVYSLDTTGKRTGEVKTRRNGGEISFEANTSNGVIYYELTL